MRLHIYGIGSPSGDDQAGWLVVDALTALGVGSGADVVIAKLDRPGAGLVARLDAAEHAILIDAMQSGAPPGTLHRFDPAEVPLPAADLSSHGFGVFAALALAQALGKLPPRVEVIGIEIAQAAPGGAVSAPVRSAAGRVARQLAATLAG